MVMTTVGRMGSEMGEQEAAGDPPHREALRVVVAHDWLVRYAGSERVVEQLLQTFPGARLVTTLVNPGALPSSLRRAEPSLLNRVPGIRAHHEWALGLMPLAWRLRPPVSDADAVVASSHACAHAVRATPGTPIIAYCHTPMRYAWDFGSEKGRFPTAVRPGARLAMRAFRRWDRNTAAGVTHFVANSSAVASRVTAYYGRTADVVHPPVRTTFFTPSGERGDRFLYVGRLTGYKRPDIAVDAFAGLGAELDVVGEGPMFDRLRSSAGPNVRLLGSVSDAELRDLYRQARALVFPVNEDFGITMAEAQACGAPVIGLAAGGALDIVEHGVTGWLIRRQNVDELRHAIRTAVTTDLEEKTIRASAERFSEERFRCTMIEVVCEVVARAPRRSSTLRSVRAR